MAQNRYRHLGDYSDLVDATRSLRGSREPPWSAGVSPAGIRQLLDVGFRPEAPRDPVVGRSWQRGGVRGEELSWSVGYGPRTHAWLLRPASPSAARLPGVLALHDHGNFKLLGKEKVADDDHAPVDAVRRLRERAYGGVAFANRLAERGFVVLVPDVFLWGSRRFALATMPERTPELVAGAVAGYRDRGEPDDVARYNAAAELHEHLVAKYCAALGTSIAALVSYEDRVALNYLTSRPEVDGGRLGAIGLSGGGARAALLSATHDGLAATVVVGMMSTYGALLDAHVHAHTWMMFPPGLARHGDWPDVAACAAPRPLLVQYAEDDALFPVAGMREADAAIRRTYATAGAAGGYQGRFYPGPHRFDMEMQDAAFDWLDATLTP